VSVTTNQWYFAKDGKRFGPFTFQQFQQLAASGALSPTDMVWDEGASYWISANDVPALFYVAMVPPTSNSTTPAPSPPTTPHGQIRERASVEAVPMRAGGSLTTSHSDRSIRSTDKTPKVSPLETASHLAHEYQLGELKAQYRSSIFLRVSIVIGSAIGFLLACGGVVSTLSKLKDLASWIEKRFQLILILMGAAILLGVAAYVIGGLVFFVFTKRWRTFVFVFAKGLVCVKPSFSRAFRWEAIYLVWESTEIVGGETRHCYRIQDSDGRQITFSGLRRIGKLADTIWDNIYDRLWHTAMTAFKAGQPIHFGQSIRLDHASLTIGQTTLPWSEIKDVRLQDKTGKIFVVRKHSWFKVCAGHISEIPNYLVLIGLVQEILTLRESLPRK
jgi:hypothetical protein